VQQNSKRQKEVEATKSNKRQQGNKTMKGKKRER
jgi:hypothetical protein